ncbi:hypothetical protein ROZALSC1DRAFT_17042 [Rozella allomycis CSF55]|uniref:RING-type domain-containing protein n=1 Tax=Rozella allomycis (strain CSF55) TaxID=988480 RepID=A0A4V1IZ55_ROZAC|nr:hypothetical protein ROZALSC1DRAFT_17042 [Rozella allomycis CSF55]
MNSEISQIEIHQINSEISKIRKEFVNYIREYNLINKIFNSRIIYFKQLQSLSDKVTLPQVDDIDDFVNQLLLNTQNTFALINQQEAKIRYLLNLQQLNHNDEICVICRSKYENGLLTECGHIGCTKCMTAWIKSKNKCPVCNASINQKFTLVSNNEISTKKPKYIPPPQFSTKIDFVVRSILHLNKTDPDAKYLVFSEWDQALHLLQKALSSHNIKSIRLERKNNAVHQFNVDDSIKVFILHARMQSAGLTLTRATHVFLLEPCLNPALEKQAIGRVHRFGQKKETFVYKPFVIDTVEERICNSDLTDLKVDNLPIDFVSNVIFGD